MTAHDMTIATITPYQIHAGDIISLRSDGSLPFTVRSIRDGLKTGIGVRTTDGEYAKIPYTATVYRIEKEA